MARIRQDVYDRFFTRWAGPAMRWTHLLLEPMTPAARYFLLAQDGADGLRAGSTPKQLLADAFVNNFDDPAELADTLRDMRKTRRAVIDLLGPRSDWEVLKGFAAVGGRRLRHALHA